MHGRPAERAIVQHGFASRRKRLDRETEKIGTRERLVGLHVRAWFPGEVATQQQDHAAIERFAAARGGEADGESSALGRGSYCAILALLPVTSLQGGRTPGDYPPQQPR